MLKWIAAIAAFVVCAFVAFSLLQGQSLRHASLIDGRNRLRVAYDDYTKSGYITNYATSSYRVWLSTNTVTIGGNPVQSAETEHRHDGKPGAFT